MAVPVLLSSTSWAVHEQIYYTIYTYGVGQNAIATPTEHGLEI